MKHLMFILGILVLAPSVQAQNLVENHSFESYSRCPSSYTIKATGELVPGWSMPTWGTPDYFNACSRFNVGVPDNMMGNMFPAHGKAYVGLILLQEPGRMNNSLNYREYLQAKLNTPLKRDSLYVVSLWYSPADHSAYLVSSIGLLLTQKPVKEKKGVLTFEPQVETDPSSENNGCGTWYRLTDTIVATGNELYLTIGNFRIDSKTSYSRCEHPGLPEATRMVIKENDLAYYYIDEIEIIPLGPAAEDADRPGGID